MPLAALIDSIVLLTRLFRQIAPYSLAMGRTGVKGITSELVLPWGWDHPFAGYGTTPAWRRAFRLLGRASSSNSLAVCSASKGRSHASIRVVSRSSVADKNGEWSPSSSTNFAPYSSLICCWSAQDRQWSFFEPT
jgi:hypothetical protein